MPAPKVKPTPYNLRSGGRGAVRQRARHRVRLEPAAAAIVPLPGKITGSGPALAVDPAQNNAFRAINRAWKQGASVRSCAGSAGGGALSRSAGLPESAQAELVRTWRWSPNARPPGGSR